METQSCLKKATEHPYKQYFRYSAVKDSQHVEMTQTTPFRYIRQKPPYCSLILRKELKSVLETPSERNFQPVHKQQAHGKI